MIRLVDLPRAHREIESALREALERVVAGGRYVLGPEVEAFEAEFATYVGARHCVGVGSGLDALRLALAAHDVGPGDEVLVPANTYVATWMAVSDLGAVPVPVEPDPCGWNMDPKSLEGAITSAVGQSCPSTSTANRLTSTGSWTWPVATACSLSMTRPRRTAPAAGEGVSVGSPMATAWSFYPTKNLGALGDGGAVTTNDDAIAARLRRLRLYGFDGPDDHVECGWNSRLDEMQAAVLRVKLTRLEGWNDRRREIVGAYRVALADSGLTLPLAGASDEGVWHLFVVRCPRRDELRTRLASGGIETGVHYRRPPHVQPSFAHLGWAPGALPVAEAHHREVLSLPIGIHLADEEVAAVASTVARVAADLDG